MNCNHFFSKTYILPQEIFNFIFDKTPYRNVVELTTVSTRFYDICRKYFEKKSQIIFAENNLNIENYKITNVQDYHLINLLPYKLMTAFGGIEKILSLGFFIQDMNIHPSKIDASQLTSDFMRGNNHGFFIAYKYVVQQEEQTEIIYQSEDWQSDSDWQCTTYGSKRKIEDFPDSYFMNLFKFYQTGESKIELFNKRLYPITLIPLEDDCWVESESEEISSLGSFKRSCNRTMRRFRHFFGTVNKDKSKAELL